MDLFSCRLLGYALGERHDAQLVAVALQMAVAIRRGGLDGVIFHGDRGSEYTSALFNDLCARLGVVQSVACSLTAGGVSAGQGVSRFRHCSDTGAASA